MASKRDFKKYVDQLGSVVVDEMVSAYYNVKEVDRDKVSQAIEKVLGAIGRAKCNSNVFFDRGEKAFESKEAYSKAKKAFFVALFDKIITDFNEEVNQALKVINEALPESERERNKAYAKAEAEA